MHLSKLHTPLGDMNRVIRQQTNAWYPLLSLFPLKVDSVEQPATDEPTFDYGKTMRLDYIKLN
jgi:hypothetical protein